MALIAGRSLCGWLLSLALSLGGVASAKDKLIVLDLAPGAEVSPEVAGALTEAVAVAAGTAGIYDVVSARELQALIGVERQRHLMGCTQDTSCMTEIGSALGARYLLRGSVGKLGAAFQLALQLVDTQKAETVSRTTRIAPTVEGLRARLPYAVAAATGLPAPAGPSRIPSLSSLGGGAVLVLGGALLGGLAMGEDDVIFREQQRAVEGSLDTRASYAATRDRLVLQKTGAVAAVGIGVGLVALGLWLWPEDLSRDGLSLQVGPSSVGIAGVFP